MSGVFIYLIKVMLCSAVFFLYYLLALRNKSFHPYNRFYLVSSAFLSCTLPLLHVSMFDMQSNNAKMLELMQLMYGGNLPDVVVGAQHKPIIDWKELVLIISLAITGVLLLLIAIRVIKIYRLKKRFPTVQVEDVDFINTNIEHAPFSFMRNLFWRNDIELEDEVGSQIFNHELAHIHQKHSLDKLFFQILLAIYWMNPFFYFMYKELMLIHEFIADEKALKDKNGEAFARMLLRMQFGNFSYEPAHPVFYSNIKKRLLMITNSKKPKHSYLRRLMVLPLLGCVTFVFAFRAHKIEMQKNEEAVDNMIDVLKQQNSATNISLEKSIAKKSKDTTVIIMPSDAKNDTIHLPLRGNVFSTDQEPIYFINGQQVNNIEKFLTENIKNVEVIKQKNNYGDENVRNMIIITTKDAVQNIDSSKKYNLRIIGYPVTAHSINDNAFIAADIVDINSKKINPLVYINGVKIKNGDIKNINPNLIQSITVLKDSHAFEKYGEDAKNGVIEIHTKDSLQNVFAKAIGTRNSNYLPDEMISALGIQRDDVGQKNYSVIGTFVVQKNDSLNPVTVIGYGTKKNNDVDKEFMSVQQEPTFPGGNAGWERYLKMNLRENIPSDNGAPPGKYPVIVSFLVSKTGEISNAKVISAHSPDYGTAAESIRVIMQSGKWNPAIQNRIPVTYRQRQKIIFTIAE